MHDRIERVRAKMRELNLDALVVSSRTNIRYLTGFSGSNGLAVVTVERNSCGGCFNMIPPQMQLEISMRKKIIACEHCGRILVDDYIMDVGQEEKEKQEAK